MATDKEKNAIASAAASLVKFAIEHNLSETETRRIVERALTSGYRVEEVAHDLP